MRDETFEYLSSLQTKITETDSIYLESNEDFNRGYLQGKKITIIDVMNAIQKLEVATE